MSKLSTLRPVFGLVLLIAVFAPLKSQADQVLIFKNSDPKLIISRFDSALVDKDADNLKQDIQTIDPALNIKIIPIDRVEKAVGYLSNVDENVRSVIFVGHGNERVFSLNKLQYTGGEAMAKIMSYLPPSKYSSKLSIYFMGCSMGKERSGGKLNFLQTFYNELMKVTPEPQQESVDVIAHTAMSGINSFREPSKIDWISYKSGVGKVLDRITAFFGPTGSAVIPMMIAVEVAMHQHGSPLAQFMTIATGLKLIVTKEMIERGVTKFGVKISDKSPTYNSIAQLLRTSLSPNQCRAIFQNKSI